MWGCGVERTTARECFWRKGEPSPGGKEDLWTKVLRQVLPVPWGRGSCEWDGAGRGEARGGAGRRAPTWQPQGRARPVAILEAGSWRRELLSASSSSSPSRILNVPSSLSPTFRLPRRHSLGPPGERQTVSSAGACGRRRYGMRAPKPGAKGRSQSLQGGPAGRRHCRRESFRSPAVVHSRRGLREHAACSPDTGALCEADPPRRAGCSSGGLFPPFGLVQGPRPESLVIWLHLPARCPQRKYWCLAPADLSPAQPGLETWQSPEVGRSRFGNS